MPKYHVNATIVASKYLGVFEAATPKEAERLAIKAAHVSVCHACAKEVEEPTIEDVSAELVDDEG